MSRLGKRQLNLAGEFATRSVINEIAQQGGGVRTQTIEGLDWAEMDFPTDLPRNLALTAGWAAAAQAIAV